MNFVNGLSSYLNNFPFRKEVFLSVLLCLIFALVKKLLVPKLIDKKIGKIEKNKTIKRYKIYLNYCFIFLIFFLWFSHLQTFIFSLVAVAAALVVATKELIMCITGGLLVRFNNSFKIGDRVDVDGIRGYVVEKNIATTKILEIGPEKNSQQTTGHIITVPNSIYLTKPLKNESYFQGYSINSFLFKLEDTFEHNSFEDFLLKSANEICSSYLSEATKYITKFCEKEGFDIPSIEPRVKISLNEKNEVFLQLKMPVKNSKIAETEQRLLRGFISFKGLSV